MTPISVLAISSHPGSAGTINPLRFRFLEGPACQVRFSEGRACRVRSTTFAHPSRFVGHDKRAPPNGYDKDPLQLAALAPRYLQI
jgi:hypothetical protein